jgi:hypothetical protein
MALLYHLLGVAARVEAAMSRYRLNGVLPLSWFLMLILFCFAIIGAGILSDGLEYRGVAPRPISLAEVRAEGQLAPRYVTASGMLVPAGLIEYRVQEDGEEKVYQRLVPLVAEDNSVLFVRVENAWALDAGEPARQVEITGMLSNLGPEEFVRQIEQQTAQDPNAPVQLHVDTRHRLDEGPPPGDIREGLALLLGAGLPFLLFLYAALRRGVIFQERAFAPAAASGASALDLRISGRFHLGEVRRRFLEVPGALARLEEGQLGLLAGVDASERFLGVLTKDLRGIWAILPWAKQGLKLREGFLYLGLSRRPALQVEYHDGRFFRRERMVLSFGDEAQRAAVRGELEAWAAAQGDGRQGGS